MRILAHLRMDHQPDPAALAAGLVAERIGRRISYHDPALRAALAPRRMHAAWGEVTYTDIREPASAERADLLREPAWAL